jgi:5-methylcytosine-specific restriction protein A
MAFTHEESEPIIARLITELNRSFGRWVASNEVSVALQDDKAGRALVRKAHKADEFDSSSETARNMVSWWSQRITSGESAYSNQFLRSVTQPYRYWALAAGTAPDDGEPRTFILNWHPERFVIPADVYEQYVEEVAKYGRGAFTNWSTGNRSSGITPGDRFFLFRQKSERGIVAAGQFASSIYQDENWNGEGKPANYARTTTEVWLPIEQRLTIESLNESVPDFSWKHLQGSGILLSGEDAAELLEVWNDHLSELKQSGDIEQSPDEIDTKDATYPVDAVKQVLVNRYERNPQARKACLTKFGYDCNVCGFNFETTYGDIGEEYIHVHHLVDISTLGEGYEIDPKEDLRPVCANCHSMLHTERPAMSIAALKKRLTRIGTDHPN